MFTLSVSDLEKWRTKQQMRIFYDEVLNNTEADQTLIKEARLKKDVYKELLEEYRPLLFFCEQYYKDIAITCRYVGSKQTYDAEIQHDGQVDKIEITMPIDGKRENQRAKELTEKHFSMECGDLREKLDKIKNQVCEIARKKANKNYEGMFLVIAIPEEILPIAPTHVLGEEFIEKTMKELKSLTYSAQKVFLLIFLDQGDGNALYAIK